MDKSDYEIALFNALSELQVEESMDDDQVIKTAVIIIATCKPEITESDIWKYLRITGLDLDNSFVRQGIRATVSFAHGSGLITVLESQPNGILDAYHIEDAKSEAGRGFALVMRKQIEELKKFIDIVTLI